MTSKPMQDHSPPGSGRWIETARHIFALSGLAIVQPLLDLISSNPQFLVAQGLGTVGILLFPFALTFLLPGILSLLPWLAPGGSPLRRRTIALMVWALAGCVALQGLNSLFSAPGPLLVTEAVGLGLGAAWLYSTVPAVRTFLGVLSPLVLIFPLLFVIRSGVMGPGETGPAEMPVVASSTPVVLVIFDEFPLPSVLDEHKQIDPVRFPNFHALAEGSHWFRNMTTVSEATLVAVPALVDGLLPDRHPPRSLPTLRHHPRSVFTLLQRSHRLNTHEPLTQLSPVASAAPSLQLSVLLSDLKVLFLHLLLPADLTAQLPSVSESWKNFAAQDDPGTSDLPTSLDTFQADWRGRHTSFRQFIDSIQPSQAPGLHFIHSLLPHEAWEYLPDGRLYSWQRGTGAVHGVVGRNSLGLDVNQWKDDEWLTVQAYQRHLLQMGFADLLLGELIEHLKRVGMYDRTLLVVTADHGTSFVPGTSRRRASPENHASIMSIPLFVKVPFQKVGHTSDRNVESIDVLPTIIDVLDVDVDWELDGSSALADTGERQEKVLFAWGGRRTFPTDLPQRDEVLKRRLDLFPPGPYSQVYRIGPNQDLLGKNLSEIRVEEARPSDPTFQLEGRSFFRQVDPESPFVLCHIRGRVETNRPPSRPLKIAVAVNGVIQATTQTSPVIEQNQSFSALVSPSSYRKGANHVEALIIDDASSPPVLYRPAGSATPLRVEILKNGEERLLMEGADPIPVGSEVALGWVVGGHTETQGSYFVGGWGVNRKDQELLKRVVVLVNDQAVSWGPTTLDKEDAVRMLGNPGLQRSGFHLEFPLPPGVPAGDARVTVLGVTRSGVAGHLNYPQDESNWPFAAVSAATSAAVSAATSPDLYRWGTRLDFGEGKPAVSLLGGGWGNPQLQLIWTVGRQADLRLEVERPPRAVVLEAFFKPFLATGELDSQRIQVRLNGKSAGVWTATENQFQIFRMRLEAHLFPESGEVILSLETPDSRSPQEVGVGQDARILGIAMAWMQLTPE